MLAFFSPPRARLAGRKCGRADVLVALPLFTPHEQVFFNSSSAKRATCHAVRAVPSTENPLCDKTISLVTMCVQTVKREGREFAHSSDTRDCEAR